jgi:Cu-processing system permease protein
MKSESIEIAALPGRWAGSTPGDVCSGQEAQKSVGRIKSIRAGDRTALRQIRCIAFKEFSDRFRNGWVVVCVLVWLGAISLTSFLGLLQIGRIGVQGYERTVTSLLNLVQYLVPLLGLLLGHDLLVGEQEERTLRLIVATGVNRGRLVFGKFVGGCLAMCVPLVLGFTLAGIGIAFAARDAGIAPFVRLTVSSLILGIIFLAIGLAISSLSRTRVQSLVFSLLMWGAVVFVFDLVALGILVSTHAAGASKEIDVVCDATHLNTAVDLHSGFDNVAQDKSRAEEPQRSIAGLGWLALNPIDLFRAVNLGPQLDVRASAATIAFSTALWLAGALGLSLWKVTRVDL